VVDIKEQVIEARYYVNRLKNHLKAWDKNHDNAQSVGHMQRKLMDKLHGDTIYGSHGWQGSTLDKDVDAAVKAFPSAADGEFETNLSAENLF
jgi:hypothetical protein